MPKRDEAIFGAPCWLDLSTSDIERAAAFYGGLFGWTASDTGAAFGHYTNMSKDGALVAALSPKMDPTQTSPDAWNLYFAVPDALAASDAVTHAGGTLLFDVVTIADAGSMTMFTDPTGAVAGLWQPGTHQGFHLLSEAGAPVWFELMTPDSPAAEAFYAQVLGVEISDGPEGMDYRTLNVNGEEHAGIFDGTGMFPDAPASRWTVSFGVEDVNAAVRSIEQQGGSVLTPPEDSPHGRWATVADPMGAVFIIMSV